MGGMGHDGIGENRLRGNAGEVQFSQRTPTTANDVQVGGDHYKSQRIQTWDFIIENNIPYLEGNIIKYVARWRQKGGPEDLKKAKHYLEKLIETAERNGAK